MNKELREEMEFLITCNDKSITPDVRDDVEMTLKYIDELEEKIEEAIEYIENCEWEDYPIQTTTHHKLREEIIGKVLLDILKGEE